MPAKPAYSDVARDDHDPAEAQDHDHAHEHDHHHGPGGHRHEDDHGHDNDHDHDHDHNYSRAETVSLGVSGLLVAFILIAPAVGVMSNRPIPLFAVAAMLARGWF